MSVAVHPEAGLPRIPKGRSRLGSLERPIRPIWNSRSENRDAQPLTGTLEGTGELE